MTAQRDPYVRVYYSVVDDPKFAGMKLETKGAWLDLLIAADSMYPAPAPLPRWLPKRIQVELTRRGIIDPVGSDHYRIHGLESERSKRSAAGKSGANARWNANALPSQSEAIMPNDALRSTPSNSTPLRADAREVDNQREGLPHLTPEAQAAITEASGLFVSTASDRVLTDLDGLVERQGAEAVSRAIARLRERGSRTWQQFVYGARNDLEPIPQRLSAKEREEAEMEEARKAWGVR